tara:strand:- start:22951 stop:23133 length:183 start_codon:yes stop_codon:yes gene_type:complete
MNEYIYIIKGILSEASDEEKAHYDEGYSAVKELLADGDDIAMLKSMGMLVAIAETGMFDE